uniref:Hydroxysteroid dehydrogenase-like protein 2 n=1 Tax=Parastrongyloides trichosuri TaxID=131310 RepID=A0A0N4ZXS3_PARTI
MINNTGKFAKKTIIITGGSRGIGKEIALKLAKDGANIVIAAKTATPHPKLPGTIYTVAEEIESVGGKALPCIVDVRDEKSIEKCVNAAIEKFKGIDILINNASAINLTGTLETSAKKYDLMHSVNVRGTYLMSQKCIPFLKESKNPHILNISPPLIMDKKWFQNHVAYTMTKYGMSMCVLGMHEEFRNDKIAVNALWPKTAIWTAAMEMLSSGEGMEGSRNASIMADAAYSILSKASSEYTGNFAIDESVLKNEGITDFSSYDCVPGAPLTPDFFIPDDILETFNKDFKKNVVCQNLDNVVDYFNKIINPKICQSINGTYQFNLVNENMEKSYISLDLIEGRVFKNKLDKPQTQFTLSEKLLLDIVNGGASIQTSLFTGKMIISGDMKLAYKLKKLFDNKSKL